MFVSLLVVPFLIHQYWIGDMSCRLVTWSHNCFYLQMSNFYQYLVFTVLIWKQEWIRKYVRGGMVRACLKSLIRLKVHQEIPKIHLGKYIHLPLKLSLQIRDIVLYRFSILIQCLLYFALLVISLVFFVLSRFLAVI